METLKISTVSLALYLSNFYKDFDPYAWGDTFGDPDTSNAYEIAKEFFISALEDAPMNELQKLTYIYEDLGNRKALVAGLLVIDYMNQKEDD